MTFGEEAVRGDQRASGQARARTNNTKSFLRRNTVGSAVSSRPRCSSHFGSATRRSFGQPDTADPVWRQRFGRVYTKAAIGLLAEVDTTLGHLCGHAARAVMRRQYEEYDDQHSCGWPASPAATSATCAGRSSVVSEFAPIRPIRRALGGQRIGPAPGRPAATTSELPHATSWGWKGARPHGRQGCSPARAPESRARSR